MHYSLLLVLLLIFHIKRYQKYNPKLHFFLKVFGESFLHGGQPGVGGARYVDPQDLLSAPTVDPYIPLR